MRGADDGGGGRGPGWESVGGIRLDFFSVRDIQSERPERTVTRIEEEKRFQAVYREEIKDLVLSTQRIKSKLLSSPMEGRSPNRKRGVRWSEDDFASPEKSRRQGHIRCADEDLHFQPVQSHGRERRERFVVHISSPPEAQGHRHHYHYHQHQHQHKQQQQQRDLSRGGISHHGSNLAEDKRFLGGMPRTQGDQVIAELEWRLEKLHEESESDKREAEERAGRAQLHHKGELEQFNRRCQRLEEESKISAKALEEDKEVIAELRKAKVKLEGENKTHAKALDVAKKDKERQDAKIEQLEQENRRIVDEAESHLKECKKVVSSVEKLRKKNHRLQKKNLRLKAKLRKDKMDAEKADGREAPPMSPGVDGQEEEEGRAGPDDQGTEQPAEGGQRGKEN